MNAARLARTSLLLPCLSMAAAAQTTYAVGWRDAPLANVTPNGSRTLQSRIFYPAAQAGQNAPVLARQGGWPTFVFLHGFTALGRLYPDLANRLAASGIVAVMSDTAQFDNALQRLDGIALFPTLAAENANQASFLFGAIDSKRVAVGGHSMGGGNTIRVLAANPGYVTGICFAPVDGGWSATDTPRVGVPLLILHGEGDTILPWRSNALTHYDALTGYTGLKALYLMGSACTHTSVIMFGNAEVLERSLRATLGWLGRFLSGAAAALDEAIGPPARADRNLSELRLQVDSPEHWQIGSGRLHTTQSLRVVGEPGWAGLFFAARPAAVPTPYGLLRLDPATLVYLAIPAVDATRLLDVGLAIPDDPVLVGLILPFQALATARGPRLRFTAASELRVVR